ncbi:MAG: hypothetical protein ACFFDG_12895 [Promethearchaeota archaeon]
MSIISGRSEPINRENLFILNFFIWGISANNSGKAAWNIGKISNRLSISSSN